MKETDNDKYPYLNPVIYCLRDSDMILRRLSSQVRTEVARVMNLWPVVVKVR